MLDYLNERKEYAALYRNGQAHGSDLSITTKSFTVIKDLVRSAFDRIMTIYLRKWENY
ncbi:MAG TPA: hypothetical protein VF849_01760 [Blattabacteriaceae bacterium]